MFILPLPMANTAETLALSECGLPYKPHLYTYGTLRWSSYKEKSYSTYNWLYIDVQPDKIKKSMEDVVIEVANSATSNMVKKVT